MNVTLHCYCPEFRWPEFRTKYALAYWSTSLTKMLYAFPPGLNGPQCPLCLLPQYYLVPNQEPGREHLVLKEMNQC